MISLRRSFLLLSLFGLAFAYDEGQINLKMGEIITVQETNISKAFDDSLPAIKKYITKHGWDPLSILDFEIPLSFLPDLFKTKLEMHDGYIQDLSTIYRTGDIIWQFSPEKGALYANIGWETLDISYEYSLRYMLYHRKGDCYGHYNKVTASVLIDVDLTTKKASLRFFKFTGFGDFKLKLEGHFLDKYFNLIIGAVTKAFRKEVLALVELTAQKEIEQMLQDINVEIPSNFETKVKTVVVGREFEEYMPREIVY